MIITFHKGSLAASKPSGSTLDKNAVIIRTAKRSCLQSFAQKNCFIHLPKMPAKKIKVAVFADGDDLKKAKDSGADIVGAEELVEKVKNGRNKILVAKKKKLFHLAHLHKYFFLHDADVF